MDKKGGVVVVVVAFLLLAGLGVTLFLTNHNDTVTADDLTIEYAEVDGIQMIKIRGDLKMDDLIASNISDPNDLYDWLEENVTEGEAMPFHGYPTGVQTLGCSTFTTVQDGAGFIGRNFDFSPLFSKGIVVAVDPDDGYRSIGMIPKILLSYELSDGKWEILTNPCYKAAPYATLEGLNEKGLFAALLDVNEIYDEKRYDRVAPIEGDTRNVIMMNTALRIVLDKAANVQEAMDILKQYNTSGAYQLGGLHLFLADATGAALTYEIDSQEHYFITGNVSTDKYSAVLTNHYRHDVDMDEFMEKEFSKDDPEQWSDWRQQYLINQISDNMPATGKSTYTLDQCKQLLCDVRSSQKPGEKEVTAWSIVADPFELKLNIWFNEDYSKAPVVFDLDECI